MLEEGYWSDWKYLVSLLGKEQIIDSVNQMRSLENKAFSFVCAVLEIDINQLRCYKNKHYQNTHWDYCRRSLHADSKILKLWDLLSGEILYS